MLQRTLYLEKIRPFIGRPVVKVLTGIRRCGKSVLLDQIRQDILSSGVDPSQTLVVNFESKAHAFVGSVDETYAVIQQLASSSSGKTYLFLDEIQELTGWETMINACLIDFDVDIYITGSNANLLSGELATYLSGRYVTFPVLPFSFREVVQQKRDNGESVDLQELFLAYIVRGGMPFLYQHETDERSAKQYLSDIYDAIILKDIAQRYQVRDLDLMRRLIEYLILNVGNQFSAASLVKYLKNEKRTISSETMYNYIAYCKNACLLYLVPRNDLVGKRVLQFQEKIYLSDHGIREAVFQRNERDIQQVLENIVYLELLRRGYQVSVGRQDAGEVDFVAQNGADRLYVQVSYLLATDETIEREFSVLERISDNYPKYVLSMDAINRGRNGILHQNVVNFLLGPDADSNNR